MCASCGGGGGAAGSGATTPEPKVDSCRVTLAPPSATPEATTTPAPYAVPRSTVVVDVALSLRTLEGQVDAKVPKRVAEEHDVDIGVAGRLEYTVDRGAVSAHVEGDTLVVQAPVVAHAKACAKGSCYAGCDPEARFSVRVPLRLGADYKLHAQDTHLEVTRGCQIRALGGLVTVDATPALRARLPEAEKTLRASIDRELPSFHDDAETAWKNASAPHALPLGACVILAPEGIVQGRPTGTADAAHLHLGLYARPELRGACGEPPRVIALPPLESDDKLPPEGDVHFSEVFASASAALEGTKVLFPGNEALPVEGRIKRASGPPAALDMELGGDVCGPVRAGAMRATWDDDATSVRLVGVSLFSGEGARLAKAGLAPEVFERAVEQAHVPVPVGPRDLGAMLPDLAKTASDPHASVSAHVSSAVPESAGLRGDALVATMRLRGAVSVDVK